MTLFWICFAVLMVSVAWGVMTTPVLYDRHDPDGDADTDRVVRESW